MIVVMVMAVPMRIEGRPVENDPPTIQFATASPEYFNAMGIAVRAGRAFENTDEMTSPQVVIISEAVARRFWPNANPIGARVRIDTGIPGDSDRVRRRAGRRRRTSRAHVHLARANGSRV